MIMSFGVFGYLNIYITKVYNIQKKGRSLQTTKFKNDSFVVFFYIYV